MQTPTIPSNEKARLRSIEALNIIDTPPEERFDRLTRMAKNVFNAPIALISIVDENRQWFKSCMGLLVNETPRDISFCGHAILGDEVFIIPDASKDNRFADNPLVTGEPNICFYAGCPIRSPDGQNLGTLCIIDTEPRRIDEFDVNLLMDLAAMVEEEIASVQSATIDQLTSISNRRGFLLLAEKSLSFCKRKKLTSTLAFFNLNQIERINNIHGNTVGDTALITFAELLRHHLRSYDICARLGGDEFVALFIDTREDDARSIVGKLKNIVHQFNQNGQQPYNIRFSYGLVELSPMRNQNIRDLLSNNDILRYEQEGMSLANEYLQNLSPSQHMTQERNLTS